VFKRGAKGCCVTSKTTVIYYYRFIKLKYSTKYDSLYTRLAIRGVHMLGILLRPMDGSSGNLMGLEM